MLRIDLVERIARAAHEARDGQRAFAPDPALATSMGLSADALARLMALLGFRAATGHEGAGPHWAWQGHRRARPRPRAAPGNAFAALAELTRR